MNDHVGGVTPVPKFNYKLVDKLVEAKRAENNKLLVPSLMEIKNKTLSSHSKDLQNSLCNYQKNLNKSDSSNLIREKQNLSAVLNWLNGGEN